MLTAALFFTITPTEVWSLKIHNIDLWFYCCQLIRTALALTLKIICQLRRRLFLFMEPKNWPVYVQYKNTFNEYEQVWLLIKRNCLASPNIIAARDR